MLHNDRFRCTNNWIKVEIGTHVLSLTLRQVLADFDAECNMCIDFDARCNTSIGRDAGCDMDIGLDARMWHGHCLASRKRLRLSNEAPRFSLTEYRRGRLLVNFCVEVSYIERLPSNRWLDDVFHLMAVQRATLRVWRASLLPLSAPGDVDGCSIFDYSIFGDVLAFDATYGRNKYKFTVIIFSGVNHHKQTTVFAVAVVSNETEKTYVWLLEKFLEAMNGVTPQIYPP
ncbi:hypothetical protein Lal_00024182 [Lupinus albus]|nr:hypothetical protein Lal_00024182 [Lupinus albus]